MNFGYSKGVGIGQAEQKIHKTLVEYYPSLAQLNSAPTCLNITNILLLLFSVNKKPLRHRFGLTLSLGLAIMHYFLNNLLCYNLI